MDHSPMRDWRIECGLSQAQLAKIANISVLVITRNEQGLYTEPSNKLVSEFIARAVGPYGLDERQPWQPYIDRYHAAQMIHRRGTNWKDGVVPTLYVAVTNMKHPFQIWRESLGFDTRMAFCRAACVSPPQLLSYEKANQWAMPANIYFGLKDLVNRPQWEELGLVGKEYYRVINEEIDAAK